jgi:heat shock protein HslJ/uncharacterized lipoprotein YbaY
MTRHRRLRRAALAAALALSAGTGLAETRTVSGELTHRELIAIPEGAELAVEARDGTGALVAETRAATGGAQAPLPFALEVAEGALTLRAALFLGGAPIWASDPVTVAEGTGDVALGPVMLAAWRPAGSATRFRCAETGLEIVPAGDGVRMRIGATWIELAPGPAASGSRFVAADDPGTWAWPKGNAMTVSLRGEELPACVAAVEESLAPFRARGNEPFWSLTVTGGRLAFTPMDGEGFEADLPEPEAVPGGRRYSLPERGLVLTIEDRVTRDTMTGMPHPHAVTFEAGGVTYTGTGGEPAALLAGVEWRAEDVAGGGIPDNARVTLRFLAGGRAAGGSGCNRFTGVVRLSGEGLSFGPLASTMKACPEALMTLERTFLDGLARVSGFDFDETGALILRAGAERVALFRH